MWCCAVVRTDQQYVVVHNETRSHGRAPGCAYAVENAMSTSGNMSAGHDGKREVLLGMPANSEARELSGCSPWAVA